MDFAIGLSTLPCDQYIERLLTDLQQPTMESDGKHVMLAGARVDFIRRYRRLKQRDVVRAVHAGRRNR